MYNLCSSLAERYGVKAASEIAEFEQANVNAVRTYVRDAGVDCDFVLTRAIDVQISKGHNTALKKRYDSFIAAGGKIAKEATYVDGKDAETVSRAPSRGSHGMLMMKRSYPVSKAPKARITIRQGICGLTN